MAVTLRNDAKYEIMKILREQGYPTYAKILNLFDIYLTDDPEVIGYMIPDKALIVLNQGLSIKQVSTIVRHEIMHEFLEHAMRREKWESENNMKGSHQTANIAMDYEISNRAYTDADKATARSIFLNGEVLRGLVTEDQYPGWENKTFEEMYSELVKKEQEDMQQLENLFDQFDKLDKKDLDELEKQLRDAAGEGQGQSMPNSGDGDGEEDSEENGQNGSSTSSGDGDKEKEEGQTPGQKKASDLADKVDEIQDELGQNSSNNDKPNKKGGPDNSGVFDTPQEQERKKELARRVEEIKRIFSDLKSKGQIDVENKSAIGKEKAAKAARDVERVTSNPLSKFKINLDRFVSNQIASEEEEDYSRQNPSYEDDDFFEPDIQVRETKFIPKINVYWDVSGSFNDPYKTAGAERAIATLNRYIRDEVIEVEYFYFATRVSQNRKSAGGGTNGKPIQDHIAQTRPDNVIIITDGDITDCSGTTIVPGAVWMLFYGSQSQNLIDHIKGKKETRHYLIEEW